MELARRVIEIMLFKRGPQDMPGDSTTLIGSASVYCILLFAQVSLLASSGSAVFQAVTATILLAVYVYGVLQVRKRVHRFAQTATALFATGAVVTLVMLGPTHAIAPYMLAVTQASDPQSVTMPSTLVTLSYVAMGFWGLAVYTHIYRQALDSGPWLGFGATLAFELLLLFVFSIIG